ncbi:MAG: hypothetical protein EPO21_07170 [Chloroflexota bacterium]|nr:MAG: hypothetical protein EPO21_07170 [Chloroflexota bacterium]
MPDNPILKKLQIKSGQRGIILNAPESYQSVLVQLPQDVDVAEALEGQFDFIHYFVTQKAELERQAPELKAAMKPKGMLWVSYPKGKALPTDLNRDIIRATLESSGLGLRAVSLVAIDDVWSALRLKIE